MPRKSERPADGAASSTARTQLTPSSSQEIIPISPPPQPLKRKRDPSDPSAATTLPKPLDWKPSIDLKDKVYRARNAYDKKTETQGGKRKATAKEVEKQREEMRGLSREKTTARMVCRPSLSRVGAYHECADLTR